MTRSHLERFGALLVVVVALVWAPVSGAQTVSPEPPSPPEMVADGPALDAVLGMIDGLPDAAALGAAWPDAPARLAAAAANPARSRYERERATSLLSLYPEPSTDVLLLALISGDDADVRTMARYTRSRTFGATLDATWVAQLEAVAVAGRGRESSYAVRSLRWCDAPEADTALSRLSDSADASMAALAQSIRVRRVQRLGLPSLPFLGVD